MPSELPAIRAALATPPFYLLAALSLLWAGGHTGINPPAAWALGLLGVQLSLLAIADLRTGILPHTLNALLAITGLLLTSWVMPTTLLNTLSGGILAFTGLLLAAMAAQKLSGQPALGGGDLWLAAALGLWVGASGLPMLLLGTAGAGALSIIIRKTLSTKPTRTFPFGPALAAGGWLAMLYQPAYWHFINLLAAPAS